MALFQAPLHVAVYVVPPIEAVATVFIEVHEKLGVRVTASPEGRVAAGLSQESQSPAAGAVAPSDLKQKAACSAAQALATAMRSLAFALRLYELYWGRAIAAKIPMMAITIINSTSVKPFSCLLSSFMPLGRNFSNVISMTSF